MIGIGLLSLGRNAVCIGRWLVRIVLHLYQTAIGSRWSPFLLDAEFAFGFSAALIALQFREVGFRLVNHVLISVEMELLS